MPFAIVITQMDLVTCIDPILANEAVHDMFTTVMAIDFTVGGETIPTGGSNIRVLMVVLAITVVIFTAAAFSV